MSEKNSPPSGQKSPDNNNKNKKPTTQFVKSEVLDRLYKSPETSPRDRSSASNSSPRRRGESPENNQDNDADDDNLNPLSSRSSPFSPGLAQKEYVSELRARQSSQLASIASYLESHAREPFGALCGKNLGGWTYGPSYSRTVESLEPAAESYPPSMSSRRTVVLSSARSMPFSLEQEIRRNSPSPTRLSRPGTANSVKSTMTTARNTNNTTPRTANNTRPNTAASNASARSSRSNNSNYLSSASKTSFYNVVLEAPFNVRPSSAAFPKIDVNFSNNRQQQQPTASARPLSSEFYYPSRRRVLKNDELVSKADQAVQKHREKQKRLEIQKERLRNAAPMEFRWQM